MGRRKDKEVVSFNHMLLHALYRSIIMSASVSILLCWDARAEKNKNEIKNKEGLFRFAVAWLRLAWVQRTRNIRKLQFVDP